MIHSITEEMENTERCSTQVQVDDDGGGGGRLPGFRFHPTDEELVGFYLRRKVEKKRISIDLIKHIDIYKYDPWDLPKSSHMGEKEWYFFCKRGRKYRNSIRPNRVTGSGFWKATGIDRPIYSSQAQLPVQGQGSRHRRDCIGLKKSLVFYRGSAGKGTKTDWMMHEFRLPPPDYHHVNNPPSKNSLHHTDHFQEAEVWTLCRIMKRNTSHRKCGIENWREQIMSTTTSKRNNPLTLLDHSNSKAFSIESNNQQLQGFNINFTDSTAVNQNYHHEQKSAILFSNDHVVNEFNLLAMNSSAIISEAPTTDHISSFSNFSSPEIHEPQPYGEWDELRSLVEFAGGSCGSFYSY